MNQKSCSPDDLRSYRAKRNVRMYELAAVAGIAPTTLNGYFQGRIPLTPEVSGRILAAIDRIALKEIDRDAAPIPLDAQVIIMPGVRR